MNQNDYGESLKKLMEGNFYRYRGCLITIDTKGFYWADRLYLTKPEVEGAIDRSYKIIHNSLINPPKPALWHRLWSIFTVWLLGEPKNRNK